MSASVPGSTKGLPPFQNSKLTCFAELICFVELINSSPELWTIQLNEVGVLITSQFLFLQPSRIMACQCIKQQYLRIHNSALLAFEYKLKALNITLIRLS